MSIPVLTAVTDSRWESDVVAGLAHDDAVEVVRRCVDIADVLSAAAAGLARAVLLSGDLRRLDRDALTRLTVGGVAVVGVVKVGDAVGERRLRQLGIAHIVTSATSPDEVSGAVVAAVGVVSPGRPADYADPRAALAAAAYPVEEETPAPRAGVGRIVSVWGPTGAPGRTSVALGIATELAELGVATLLVDADTYGGAVAQLLGLLDEAPGLAAACRLANNGTLDVRGLAELAVQVRPCLRVLTGITRSDRWPEVRPSALEAVLGIARTLATVVVVDCGFCLEQDEEISYDTVAPRRNGATIAALDAADIVVGVTAADPVALQRYVRGLADLRETIHGVAPVTVVTRVRESALGGGDAEDEITAALARYAGVTDVRFVPNDPAGYDAAVAAGKALVEIAPSSPARSALASIAAGLVGRRTPARRRRLGGLIRR